MKNKVLIGIIIVLVGVIIVEGVYLFTSKKEEKENNSSINIPKEEKEENESNDNETSEDYVKLVNTKEEDNQVIQEYEMVLNGEYQEFEIVFENTSNDDTTEVIGKFKDIQVYTYMLPYFDNEFNFDNVKDDLNSNNFQKEFKARSNGVQKINNGEKSLPIFKNNSEKYEYLIKHNPSDTWIAEFKQTKEYKLLYE